MWKKLIAWFIKTAWPEIQKMIVKLLPVIMEWFASVIEEAFKKKTRQKAEAAKEKSQAASEKAETASTDTEAAAYRAEAETWRKVAQDYERELAEIKQVLKESQQQVQPIIENEVNHMDPEKLFTNPNTQELSLNTNYLSGITSKDLKKITR